MQGDGSYVSFETQEPSPMLFPLNPRNLCYNNLKKLLVINVNNSFSRRQYNRVKFQDTIQSTIELETRSYENEFKLSGGFSIFVIDISAGGLRFVTKKEFPVNFIAVYKISLKINTKDLVLFGKIIRKRRLINNYIEYGVKFDFDYGFVKGLF